MGSAAAKRIRRRGVGETAEVADAVAGARRSEADANEEISGVRIIRGFTSLAAVGATFSTLLFAGRVLVVAHFDPDVSTALLINTSLTVVIQSIVLQVFPVLAFFGGLIAIYLGGHQLSERPRRGPAVTRGLLLIVGGLSLLPPLVLTQFYDGIVIPGVVGLVMPFTAFVYGWTRRNLANFESMFALPLIFLAFISVATAVIAGMWLPPETVKTNGIQTVIYVLSDDGADVVAFSPGDHSVLRLPASSISGRQYCRKSNIQTLATEMFRPPTTQICPSPQQIFKG